MILSSETNFCEHTRRVLKEYKLDLPFPTVLCTHLYYCRILNVIKTEEEYSSPILPAVSTQDVKQQKTWLIRVHAVL